MNKNPRGQLTIIETDGKGHYDRIRELKKWIKNTKFLIENIQIALQSTLIETKYQVRIGCELCLTGILRKMQRLRHQYGAEE